MRHSSDLVSLTKIVDVTTPNCRFRGLAGCGAMLYPSSGRAANDRDRIAVATIASDSVGLGYARMGGERR